MAAQLDEILAGSVDALEASLISSLNNEIAIMLAHAERERAKSQAEALAKVSRWLRHDGETLQ